MPMIEEQPIETSLDATSVVTVEMKTGTPSMAGWNVEFVIEDLAGTALLTKTSPGSVTINDGTTPKTIIVTVTRAEAIAAGLLKGREYKYKFRRTDLGAEKRLAHGSWTMWRW